MEDGLKTSAWHRSASALLLAVAFALPGCDGKPAASPEEAPARLHDALQRPQMFRKAFAELKARPELKGQVPKVFQYVFFHDDGLIMLKVQNARNPGQLDHYEYRPAAYDRPTPSWEGPSVFARDRNPEELAPQLVSLDAIPLQALPIADAEMDRQLESLKARHPKRREDLDAADSDRSIHFVVSGPDGAQRWESTLNDLQVWPMSAYRFVFRADGGFDKLEETPARDDAFRAKHR